MGTWNYRVVRSIEKDLDGEPVEQYAIHETHYDKLGMPSSITANAMTTSFESVDELRDALIRMLDSCVTKPVLNYDDF